MSLETKRPFCKCGKPCEYLSIANGYSKNCARCNQKQARRVRGKSE